MSTKNNMPLVPIMDASIMCKGRYGMSDGSGNAEAGYYAIKKISGKLYWVKIGTDLEKLGLEDE